MMDGNSIGVVVIGRNEGARLQRCLLSVRDKAAAVVYVDSGSTDDSVSMALGLGVAVVQLDMAMPFTAARARNEGFSKLITIRPDLAYVQFVDGDCEVVASWLEKAHSFLDTHPAVGVVCGRRRERFPQCSIYNLLCDIEWDTPIGEATACGGDALFEATAFKTVGGYRGDLIAGEEPELCVRLRAAGWKVWRLDAEMTWHDAAMTKFGQWWKRSMRGGHAYAEGAYLHGAPPERHSVRESRRIWFWGLGVPLGVAAGTFAFGWLALWLALVYPIQIMRLTLRGQRSFGINSIHSLFLVLGKFPELQGQFTFWWRRVGAGKARLIEYK